MNISRGRQGGFTLIELLVVIAIIGILAAIILASLGTARSKGSDANTKESLREIATQMETLNTGASYPTACGATGASNVATDSTLLAIANQINSNAGSFTCNASASAYAVYAPLKSPVTSGDVWCVDSAGLSQEEASPGSATHC